MPGGRFDTDADFDSQDQAETLDESMTVGGEGGEIRTFGEADDMRTFEELPDVLDVTQARGDRDDDEGLALDSDEFDEDAFDDGDFEEDDELNYRAVEADDNEPEEAAFDDDAFDEDQVDDESIEGLEMVADADAVSGGEDDFTNFQSKGLSDEDLARMGYTDDTGTRKTRP